MDSVMVGQRQKLNSERSDGGYGHSDLAIVPEHGERPESLESEDADDEQDLSKAASVIQGKFRERLQRRSREQADLVTG